MLRARPSSAIRADVCDTVYVWTMRTALLLAIAALIGCSPSETRKRSPVTPTDTASPTTDALIPFVGDPPRNVLMISIDTWRRDHFDPHGDGTVYAPFLASLAETGVTLTRHTTCSNWTYPGTTCTLLGMYNVDNGFLPKMAVDYRDPVPDGTPFLATHLRDAGYHNLLVSGNTWLGEAYNNAQGYHDADAPNVQNTTLLFDEGIRRLEAAVNPEVDPWFLHVHLMEPHVSYNPPEGYLTALDDLEPLPWDVSVHEVHYDATRTWPELEPDQQALLESHLRIRYAAEIRYLDDQLASIFTDLDARGLLDDTLVVFWSDHGESFWEHGHQTHAWTLHRPENDGIAFFWSKNIETLSWPGPTSSIDIAPTILSILDLDIPAEMTGWPVGEAPADRYRYGYSISRSVPMQSIQTTGWKLIYLWDGTVELYNLHADPDEADDLYNPEHPMAQHLWQALRPRVEATTLLAEEWSITWPEGLD